MKSKLIVALDFDNQSEALSLVNQLNPNWCALKVGSEMFTLLGANFVRALIARQFRVFLDLKFHDIPTTVARACVVACDLGIWMLNVHASGGRAMMESAASAVAAYGTERPLLIAVTVLTSMVADDLPALGITQSLDEHVSKLAVMAREAGLDGVVSSAFEVPLIKAVCGADFLTVTPGIRLPGSAQDDQTRIITPQQAIEAGSDYIVMGRPITRAAHPASVVRELLNDV
ncbi:MAG: orotidine-5'-phosphate decarboxylase [Legionellaceae bacterium]|nr:orotidine-5'-phosphate decarboxylase [Legionellaceae bacterium]